MQWFMLSFTRRTVMLSLLEDLKMVSSHRYGQLS